MKLRIHNDSIQLQLSASEAERFGAGRSIVASTRFPGGSRFTYALVTTREPLLSTSMDGHTLTVRVPAQDARRWAADPDQGALTGAADESCGMPAVLVEKDYGWHSPPPDHTAPERAVNPRPAMVTAAI